MTNTQVEVITSVRRRRSWSRAENERIVAAALEPRGRFGGGARRWDLYRPIVSLTPAAL